MEFLSILYLVPALSHIHFNSQPQTLNMQFQPILFTDTSITMITPKVIYFYTELIMHLPS